MVRVLVSSGVDQRFDLSPGQTKTRKFVLVASPLSMKE